MYKDMVSKKREGASRAPIFVPADPFACNMANFVCIRENFAHVPSLFGFEVFKLIFRIQNKENQSNLVKTFNSHGKFVVYLHRQLKKNKLA